MKHFALLCFAVLFLAAGCISYQYEGVREAEPTTHVKVYTDATRIRPPYRVLAVSYTHLAPGVVRMDRRGPAPDMALVDIAHVAAVTLRQREIPRIAGRCV